MTHAPLRRLTLAAMMKLTLSTAIVIALLVAAPALRAQSGYDLFQKALATERADGNLRGAIQLYERVVKEHAADRALVARALVRIADCHEKLGQRDAAKYYERVVREFGDQSESVTVARARLDALQSPAAAVASQTTRMVWKGPDVDAMGTPSADGRYLSYTDWNIGDLMLRDLVEGTSKRLTNSRGWELSGDYAELSVVSPDGRQVAYTWFTERTPESGATCVCRYEIRIMPVAGPDAGRPRVVLSGDSPKFWARPSGWLPDGKGLVVLRVPDSRHSDVAVVSFSDNSVRSIKSLNGALPERVSVSPDGRTVALDVPVSDTAPAHDIVLVNVNDASERVGVRNPAHDYAPVFSADGRHLLFLSDRTGTNALWRVQMSNGETIGDPVFVSAVMGSSDLLGTTRAGAVYFSAPGADSNIYGLTVDEQFRGRGNPELMVERFINSNTGPALSPDGQSLAYLTSRASSRKPAAASLMIHSFATKQDRQVPTSVSPGDSVSWFPDGRSVLIAEQRQESPGFNYYQVDLATGEHRLLVSTRGRGIPTRRPVVSPDGRSIFYSEGLEASEVSRLGRFDLASRTEVELYAVQRPGGITSFRVSPDGNEVALLRSENPSWSILEVIPSGGGPARQLFRDKNLGGARFSGLAWSPDKRFLLLTRNVEGSNPGEKTALWKVPTSGGSPEPVGLTFDGIMRFASVDQANSRLIFAGAKSGNAAILSIENFLPKQ